MPRVGVVLVATVLVLSCAGCSREPDGPLGGKPTPSTTSSATSSPTASPTVPPDLVKYTPEERAAFETPLPAYVDFSRRTTDSWRSGSRRRRSQPFYHKHSIDWVEDWANLAQLANETPFG